MDVGTTEARGGRDLGCDSVPPEVGGRLELDLGRPSRGLSGTLKLVEGAEEETERKDCDCAEVFGGARKDWPGSRKEWLLEGLKVERSMLDVWTCQAAGAW
jgi:hypothetical protein